MTRRYSVRATVPFYCSAVVEASSDAEAVELAKKIPNDRWSIEDHCPLSGVHVLDDDLDGDRLPLESEVRSAVSVELRLGKLALGQDCAFRFLRSTKTDVLLLSRLPDGSFQARAKGWEHRKVAGDLPRAVGLDASAAFGIGEVLEEVLPTDWFDRDLLQEAA